MKNSLLLILLTISISVQSQIQSDTSEISLNDSVNIKVVNGYFYGDILYSYNLSKWFQLGKGPLPYLLRDLKDLYTIEHSSYAFIPSGLLKLNDSTSFIIGWGGTYEYRGVILKSSDFGLNWDIYKLPDFNSILRPRDQFFINQQIGLTIFKIHPTKKHKYSIGITYNQGESWNEKKIKSDSFKIRRNGLVILGEIKTKNDYYRFIEGKYSLNFGKTWISFKIGSSQ